MYTIGVDYHKRTSTYAVYDSNGRRQARQKLDNRPELIAPFLEQWTGPKQLAMEATRNWGIFYDFVQDKVDQFYLGHPKKMKAITESETKHDAADADMIARLTQSGFLPKAHVSSSETRQLRSLVRYRSFLVRQRGAVKNQIHVLLDRNLWPCDRPKTFKDIFCQRGLRWLKGVALPRQERFVLDRALSNYTHLVEEISTFEKEIETRYLELPGLNHLRTVPGFQRSFLLGATVLLEIDTIDRFRKARHLSHYAGLIPSTRSSDGKLLKRSRLVQGANKILRTAFIEATFPALRVDKGLKAYYQKVKQQAGSGSAIIACARKLSYAVYHVLKEQTAYKPIPMQQDESTAPSVTVCHPSSAIQR
jgi:transposase